MNNYPLFLHLLINKIYGADFAFYKALYFSYKNFFERKEVEFIRKNVKPGDRVLDIGANIGFYTLLLSDLVGNKGKVIAFEPEKKNFQHLKSLCKGRKNIDLKNLAVGEKNGIINLYISDKMNVDHHTFDNKEGREVSKVKCVSIDEYLGPNKKINFIKVDTQGFEYKILLGMRKTLLYSKNVILFCEVVPEGLMKTGSSVDKFLLFLRNLGFVVRGVEGIESKPYLDITASRNF